MSVKIMGIDTVRRELAELESLLASPKPIAGFVEDAKTEILVKTALGKDFKNRSFESYSTGYAKRKKGMTATGRPNLKVTGTMLGAITTRVESPTHAVIDVAPDAEGGGANAQMLAQIHNTGTGKQPTREFMNLNNSQVAKLKKKHWDDPILAIVRRYR